MADIKKEEIFSTLKEIYPINRSITGNGVRETLKILSSIIDINVIEIPSGTTAFDWVVPEEWNISEAYIEKLNGERIVDFGENNLHIVSYSEPIDRIINKEELLKHIHYIKDKPECIPYITSYYNRDWGFCIRYKDLDLFEDESYHVKINSKFESGSMTIGEIILPGKTNKEILLSTNICHPSMANNESSGPALVAHLAKHIADNMKDRRYTYRILFLPETIGAITYLSKNLAEIKNNVLCGYTITCVGAGSCLNYIKNIKKDSFINKLTLHILKHSGEKYNVHEFSERGSDERQYCFPGIDLDIGSITREKYWDYYYYHTSGDNLDFVDQDMLYRSFSTYVACINSIEKIKTYKCNILCEPMMSKRGIYPTLGTRENMVLIKNTRDVLAYCDGNRDTLEIANILGLYILDVEAIIDILLVHNLITEV